MNFAVHISAIIIFEKKRIFLIMVLLKMGGGYKDFIKNDLKTRIIGY